MNDKQKVLMALRGARKAIATYGWVRVDWGHVNRGFCVTGAIRHAIHGQPEGIYKLRDDQLSLCLDARAVVQAILEEWGTPIGGSVLIWNDTIAKDKDEVLGVLDLAIMRVHSWN